MFDALTNAYTETHLTSGIKWVKTDNELDVGSQMLDSTIQASLASLVSLEQITHYTRIVNTKNISYTQASNKAGTTYEPMMIMNHIMSATIRTNAITYTKTQNTAITTYVES